jgi:hypothetical protein
VAKEAFNNAKRLPAAAVPLQHPAPKTEFPWSMTLLTPTWEGVMQQKAGEHWRLPGFFSKKLTEMESLYSTFNRELLAVYLPIQHFFHFCESHLFQL